jgi:hypothetical protein
MAERRMVGTVAVAVTVALALVLAACGGGSSEEGGDGDADGAAVADDAGAVLAELLVLEPTVSLGLDGDDPSPVEGTVEVGVGGKVRTDASGFGELGLLLGSLLRLDADTSIELLEHADDGGASLVRARVESGRTWSRTGDLDSDDSYVIETPTAEAKAAPGTAFVTECNELRCTFAVLKGRLDVELADGTAVTVEAPASVEVRDGIIGEPVLVPFDGAFGDPWLVENNDRDVEAGLDDVVAAYAELDPTLASLAGTFTGTRTITEVACDPACSGSEAAVGDVAERSYAFDIDCSKGTPCTGTVDTEYVINDEVVSGVQPLTFDGTTYRWAVEQAIPACRSDGTGEVVVTIEWALTPTAAEIREEGFAVTALEGEVISTNVVTAPGTCTGDRRSDTSTSTVSVSR